MPVKTLALTPLLAFMGDTQLKKKNSGKQPNPLTFSRENPVKI